MTLNARTIAFYAPQTSADLLQQTGKVYVQKSQLGGGSPMIRGFATNRLVLSVDGVRMNNAIFRGGNLQNVISIDPFSVQRTEVIFGPGSVIYGSDAIGGVMNFYTKEATLSQRDTLDVSISGNLRYASANAERTAHLEANVGARKWAAFSSLSYSRFGDLVMGSHGPERYLRNQYVETSKGVDRLLDNPNPEEQLGSGYDQINFNQKLRYRPNAQWDAKLGFHYSETSNYGRYDRLIRPSADGEGLRSAEWYYGPQKWLMTQCTTYPKGP